MNKPPSRGIKVKQEFELNVQERVLKAFLDLIILEFLRNQSMTAYQIQKAFLCRFDDSLSPNTVYTRLSTMETQSLIQCALSTRGRVYSLTEDGAKVVEVIPTIVKQIQRVALLLYPINHPDRNKIYSTKVEH